MSNKTKKFGDPRKRSVNHSKLNKGQIKISFIEGSQFEGIMKQSLIESMRSPSDNYIDNIGSTIINTLLLCDENGMNLQSFPKIDPFTPDFLEMFDEGTLSFGSMNTYYSTELSQNPRIKQFDVKSFREGLINLSKDFDILGLGDWGYGPEMYIKRKSSI